MNFLFKTSGALSKMNVVNLSVLLLALFDIFKPFVPAEYLAITISVVSAVNLILRTFYTSEPIKGQE